MERDGGLCCESGSPDWFSFMVVLPESGIGEPEMYNCWDTARDGFKSIGIVLPLRTKMNTNRIDATDFLKEFDMWKNEKYKKIETPHDMAGFIAEHDLRKRDFVYYGVICLEAIKRRHPKKKKNRPAVPVPYEVLRCIFSRVHFENVELMAMCLVNRTWCRAIDDECSRERMYLEAMGRLRSTSYKYLSRVYPIMSRCLYGPVFTFTYGSVTGDEMECFIRRNFGRRGPEWLEGLYSVNVECSPSKMVIQKMKGVTPEVLVNIVR